MSKSKVTVVAAPAVRAFFAENPTLVPEGDKSVGSEWTGRGRISKPALAVFTEKTGKVYGKEAAKATITLPVTKVSKSGQVLKRPVEVPLADFRALSGQPKGRPSKASLAKAAEAYAKAQG